MLKYIDAHCHLQNIEDISAELPKAMSAGIYGFICNATEPNDWNSVLNLIHRYENIYGCIGVHPWHVNLLSDGWELKMHSILRQNPDLMVGEIGLDKLHPNIELQEQVFIKQLDMAHKLNRVAHIHCVGSWDIMLRILKLHKERLPKTMIFHSFTGSVEIQNQLLRDYNVLFSFSSMILDGRRARLAETVKYSPIGKILAESDDKKPEIIIDIIKRIGEIKGIAPEKITDKIYKNTLDILKNG